MSERRSYDPESHAPRLAPWGAALALMGAAIGGWIGVLLSLFGVVLLLVACISRQDGFLLFGPISLAELTRAARLGRPWLWRSVYAIAAGLIVLFNLAAVLPWSELFWAPRIQHTRMPGINLAISYWFAVCLFLYTGVLTVQVLAGAIAEEREKKRWDALLTTDLRGREILLGKFAGRILVILEPLFAVLPVLAALPMFGGVPPWLAGTTALACLSLIFGLGGMSLFYSVFAPTRSSAISLTVFTSILYVIVSASLTFV